MRIVKRFIIFVFVIILLFSLCGCETKEERELRESQERVERLTVEYEKAKSESEKFKRDVDAYYDALDAVKKAEPSSTSSYKSNSYKSSNGCGYKYSDGSTCGASVGSHSPLCDYHFNKLDSTYKYYTGY